MKIRIVEDVFQLSSEWTQLAQQAGEHFSHFPGWYEAQQIAYPDQKSIFFVAIYDDQGLAAVLPFQQDKLIVNKLSIPLLVLYYPNEMGVADITSRIDLTSCRRIIFREIKRHGIRFWCVKYHSVLEQSHVFSSQLFDIRFLCKHSHLSKYLNISDGVENFYQNRNKKLRRNIQQKLRYAQQEGQLSICSVTQEPDLASAYDTFLALEASGWKGEGNTSILQQQDKRHYYDRLFEYYSAEKRLAINILFIDDKPIAGQFGIVCSDELYLLKIAYDENYSRISPGNLLIDQLMKHLEEKNTIKKVCFVTGTSWMDRWYPEINQVWVGYDLKCQLLNKILGSCFQWWRKRRELKGGNKLPP